MNITEKIVDKLFSGRFLVTIMMAGVYCFLAIFMVTKLSDKITGDFVLGYMGGFSTAFMLILQWYFDKEEIDAKSQNGGSNEIPKQNP